MIQFNKNLFLVRHGEVDYNRQGIIAGSTDRPLNETGRRQAEEAAEKVKNLGIDILITSDLKRAKETAEAIGKKIGLPVMIEPAFRERNYGSIEGKSKKDLKKMYPEYMSEKGTLILENEFPEAEPVHDFCKRIIEAVDSLLKKYSDKNILLVTHAGIFRVLYAYKHNIPYNKAREVYKPEDTNCLIENY
ncbi:histidine phosphatase family protein [Candidatus Peregrinibacteria bacterium]|nr:histidine phosphatase family protein [Candidatus Peregrinibacteria bacterium]